VNTLHAADRSALLRLARLSIEDAILGSRSVESALAAIELTSPLVEKRGAFVTLWEKEGNDAEEDRRLRGCIGTIESADPLYRNVLRNAAHAALEDPRFAPVAAAELTRLQIEISALTPLLSVEGPEAIVIGTDGVVLEKGAFRAVFLPQVAVEQGWNTVQFLEHLARKAGLPPDDWKGAMLRTFGAEVFGEGDG
jgi:AmmeMemoRadiSam system protein A